MDLLCEEIDKLVIDYLEEFGHLLACKQLIDDTMRQGYFNLSRARVIMGVNNLSQLQYSEKDPMVASTTFSIESSSLDIEKHIDKDHYDDALKWFGLLSPAALKQSRKSFQQTIDLTLEACKRQENILKLKVKIEKLLSEKMTLSTKENSNENKNDDNISF